MKAIAVVLAVSFVVVLGQLTDEQKAKLKQYKESCVAETGVDTNALENAKKGMIDDSDEKLACFATCLLKKIGIMTQDGDIDIEVVRSKIPPGVPQEETERVINKCKEPAGTGCRKGGNLMKCVLETKTISLLN